MRYTVSRQLNFCPDRLYDKKRHGNVALVPLSCDERLHPLRGYAVVSTHSNAQVVAEVLCDVSGDA
jgi:hypothetical protein